MPFFFWFRSQSCAGAGLWRGTPHVCDPECTPVAIGSPRSVADGAPRLNATSHGSHGGRTAVGTAVVGTVCGESTLRVDWGRLGAGALRAAGHCFPGGTRTRHRSPLVHNLVTRLPGASGMCPPDARVLADRVSPAAPPLALAPAKHLAHQPPGLNRRVGWCAQSTLIRCCFFFGGGQARGVYLPTVSTASAR